MSQNNIFGQILQGIAPQQNVRDWQHAARTFVDSLYRLSPKYQSLFHVYMDINTDISGIQPMAQRETGMMAKQVNLPKFTVATKTYNAYNRKTVQQEKVSYEPVNITFHDDSDNVVRSFWKDYFTYYYRDSDYGSAGGGLDNYKDNSKYKTRQQQNWGYSPRTSNSANLPYLNSIRIYSLSKKRFSSYTLVRPVISSFQHGTHTTGEYTPMEHTMTVNYEAVLYDTGPVSNGTVLGIDTHYDHTPSPLRNLGSLIGGAESIFKNIENGDLGSAVQNAFNVYNVATGSDKQLVQTPSLNILGIGQAILQGQNPLSTVFAPTSATVNQGLSGSIYAQPGLGSIINAVNINGQNNNLPSSAQGRIDL
jgi:hypothetical protein